VRPWWWLSEDSSPPFAAARAANQPLWNDELSPHQTIAAAAVLSVAAVYAVASVASGTALSVSALTDEYPYSVGEYIRIYIWSILLWGQASLLIPWFITIPLVIALGLLIASGVRKTDESTEQTPVR
jgi:hypothetical protein